MSTPEGGEVVADRYRLASLIGQGGNGAVWRAQDTLLGRAVAVKRIEIPPQLNEAEGAKLRRKVLHEARACARLTHPGAVTVFDVVEDTGDRDRGWVETDLLPRLPQGGRFPGSIGGVHRAAGQRNLAGVLPEVRVTDGERHRQRAIGRGI